MPKYCTIIEGQNFDFMLENELQRLDFHCTFCLEAESIDSARQRALGFVIAELSGHQQIFSNESPNKPKVSLEHIEEVNSLDTRCSQDEFNWHFPGDALFVHKLKRA